MVCVRFMLVITPDVSFFWCFLGPSLTINQYPESIAFIHHFVDPLSSQMQWIRLPSGCRHLQTFFAIYLVFQTSQYVHIATCRALHKTKCSRGMYHSATVWVNRILSVYFCKRNVRGKPFSFSKFSWTWRTYHSGLYWGSLWLAPIRLAPINLQLVRSRFSSETWKHSSYWGIRSIWCVAKICLQILKPAIDEGNLCMVILYSNNLISRR